ncbi:F-box domain protein [Apiospora hydei]|uniref:F-box domain protein n=1 Tax=Apiospora hydei TaxID=1337664 RepID=A0ABR1XE35_9PEZI
MPPLVTCRPRTAFLYFLQLREIVLPLDVFQCHLVDRASRVDKSIEDVVEEDPETLGLRLGNFLPGSVAQLTLSSQGQVPHDRVLAVLFHDFGALKDMRLPDMEQIIIECQLDYDPDPAFQAICEGLESEVGLSGVALHLETEPLGPELEWPGSEKFESFIGFDDPPQDEEDGAATHAIKNAFEDIGLGLGSSLPPSQGPSTSRSPYSLPTVEVAPLRFRRQVST